MAAFMNRLGRALTLNIAFATVLYGPNSLPRAFTSVNRRRIPAESFDRSLQVNGAINLFLTNGSQVCVHPSIRWMAA